MGTEKEQDHLDLDKIMEEGLEKFEGELAEAASKETDQSGSGPSSPEKPGETEHPEHEEEAPEDDEAPAATDESPKGDKAKETPKGDEAKETRFKSHDDAEEGYRNLQSKTTKVEQENARLKQELDELKNADKRKEEAQKASKDFEEFAEKRYEEALSSIDELDPDDAEYNKNVAKIWAKRDGEIRLYEREHGLTGARETAPATVETGTGKTPEEEETAARAYVAQKATEAKIDPKDPGWQFLCTQAPTEIGGKVLSFEEQVAWAIEEKKNYDAYRTSRQGMTDAEKEAEAKKKSEQRQNQELPLGRGPSSTKKAGEETAKPVTLDDALQMVMEERTL